MTRKELRAEHRECDRQVNPVQRLIYKVLHLRRRGCPECKKLGSVTLPLS